MKYLLFIAILLSVSCVTKQKISGKYTSRNIDIHFVEDGTYSLKNSSIDNYTDTGQWTIKENKIVLNSNYYCKNADDRIKILRKEFSKNPSLRTFKLTDQYNEALLGSRLIINDSIKLNYENSTLEVNIVDLKKVAILSLPYYKELLNLEDNVSYLEIIVVDSHMPFKHFYKDFELEIISNDTIVLPYMKNLVKLTKLK